MKRLQRYITVLLIVLNSFTGVCAYAADNEDTNAVPAVVLELQQENGSSITGTELQATTERQARSVEKYAREQVAQAEDRGEQVTIIADGQPVGRLENWFNKNIWFQNNYNLSLAIFRGVFAGGTAYMIMMTSSHGAEWHQPVLGSVLAGAMSFTLQVKREFFNAYYSGPETLPGRLARFGLVEFFYLALFNGGNLFSGLPMQNIANLNDLILATAATTVVAVPTQGTPEIGISTWLLNANRQRPLSVKYNWFKRNTAVVMLSVLSVGLAATDLTGDGITGKVLMGTMGVAGFVFSSYMQRTWKRLNGTAPCKTALTKNE